MYSIEINLLRDRPEYSQETSGYASAVNTDDKTPLFLGVAFGGAMLGLVLIFLGVFSFLNQRLAAEQDDLDAKLQQLAPQVKDVEEIQAKTKTLTEETEALATVFNQIKPWSAMLQDLADRVPANLQISKVTQGNSGAAPTRPRRSNGKPQEAGAASAQNPKIKIEGFSLSFSDVNDFELTLRQSPFLLGDQTKLVLSERETSSPNRDSNVRRVKFTLDSQINAVPANELLQVLESKGASGLVSRINSLKEKGVIQP